MLSGRRGAGEHVTVRGGGAGPETGIGQCMVASVEAASAGRQMFPGAAAVRRFPFLYRKPGRRLCVRMVARTQGLDVLAGRTGKSARIDSPPAKCRVMCTVSPGLIGRAGSLSIR